MSRLAFTVCGAVVGLAFALPGNAKADVTKTQLIGKWRGAILVTLATPGKRNKRTLSASFEFKADGSLITNRYGRATPGTFVMANKGEVWFSDKKHGVWLIWVPTATNSKQLVGPVRLGPGKKLPPINKVTATLTLTRGRK